MLFKDISDNNSGEDLRELGYVSGDKVMVLFEGGEVRWGELYFEERFECLLDASLVLNSEKSIDMHWAAGIATLSFN